MVLITAIVLLPFAVRFCLSLVAAAGQVWRGGKDEAREFQRAGVTLGRFWKAKVDRQDYSSLVPTRAGVGVKFGAKGFSVRETRTISKDVF
jgi:hypothetical protein